MDIGKALTYITEDPRWKEKLAIGTGVVILSTILSVVLIGIVGYLIVLGYMVRLLQNVRDGRAYPMPEWDQWGDDLVRGLKLAVVILVWALPIILFSIPVSLGGALAEGRGAGGFIGTTILFGGMCLLILYGLFLAVAQASFTIAYARDEQIGSGLHVREIWDWTLANIGQLIIVALSVIVVGFGVSLVASLVGTLLCIIGLLVTLPLAQLVIYLFQYNLYGQLAAAAPVGEPSSAGPSWTPPTPDATATSTGAAAGTAGAAATDSGFGENPYAAYGPPSETAAQETSTPAQDVAPVDDAPVGDVPADDAPPPESGIAPSDTPGAAPGDTPAEGDTEDTYPDSGIDEKPDDEKPDR